MFIAITIVNRWIIIVCCVGRVCLRAHTLIVCGFTYIIILLLIFKLPRRSGQNWPTVRFTLRIARVRWHGRRRRYLNFIQMNAPSPLPFYPGQLPWSHRVYTFDGYVIILLFMYTQIYIYIYARAVHNIIIYVLYIIYIHIG